jgi:transposase-like protein
VTESPSKLPVRCVKCKSTAVILSNPTDQRTGERRWRYRCLDCSVAWWQDENEWWQKHGAPDEF